MHFVGQINRDCEVHPRSFALQGSAFSKRALNLTQPLQAKRRTSLTASVRQSATRDRSLHDVLVNRATRRVGRPERGAASRTAVNKVAACESAASQ
jgi:hypothetical protein